MLGFVVEYWHLIVLVTLLLAFHQVIPARFNRWWRFVGEFCVAWALSLSYFIVRGTMLGKEAQAYDNADLIIALEQRMGIFHEQRLQQLALDHEPVMRFANWIYVWWHWPLIVAVLVWLFLAHPDEYPTYRNAFLISGAIGLVIFAVFPLAPPRFLADHAFADTVDKRAIFSNILLPPSLTNLYAAMPSLHAGWNLLIGIALFRHARRPALRGFGIVMPVLMFWSIVVTGNHYILDGVAGDLIAEFGLVAAIYLSRRSRMPPASLPAPQPAFQSGQPQL